MSFFKAVNRQQWDVRLIAEKISYFQGEFIYVNIWNIREYLLDF